MKMADDILHGLRVAILVTDGFEEVELTEPRKALDQAGALCVPLVKGRLTDFFLHGYAEDEMRTIKPTPPPAIQ
jgi:putative intracellular protease/amidase